MTISRTVPHRETSAALNYCAEEKENNFSSELSLATHARKRKRKARADSAKPKSCLTRNDMMKSLLEKQAMTSNPNTLLPLLLAARRSAAARHNRKPLRDKGAKTHICVGAHKPTPTNPIEQNCSSPKLQTHFPAPRRTALAYAFISTTGTE